MRIHNLENVEKSLVFLKKQKVSCSEIIVLIIESIVTYSCQLSQKGLQNVFNLLGFF